MPSQPKGSVENFLFNAFEVSRFRCRACRNRFALRKVRGKYPPRVPGAKSRLALNLSIAVIAISLLAVAAMGIKARRAYAASHGTPAPTAAAPPQTSPRDVVGDTPSSRKANSAFMENYLTDKKTETKK